MLYYPNNHPGHFFTKLPQSIDLSAEYECGLSEILFNNTYFNVQKNELWMKFQTEADSYEHKKVIPAGLYRSFSHLTKAMNELIRSNLPNKRHGDIKIFYNDASKRVSIRLYNPGASLELSPKLKRLFKIDPNIGLWGPASFDSEGIVQLNEGLEAVYVYCDLIESRVVGDVLAPLLRTVPLGNRATDVVHFIFEKPNYVPLNRFNFNSVEVLLTTDSGKTLSFEDGKCVVTLHFRRRKPENY